jgi:hypothetical protein
VFRREFAREGLGYVLRVPELMTELAVDRITRRSDGVHGDLVVLCGLPGTRSADGHIHQARFNLSSSTARSSLAKVLEGRAKAPEVDWFDLLEDLCRRVMSAEREGEPVTKVGALPVELRESYRLDPILPLEQVTILYGDGGVGKSTLATAIAVSVGEGIALIEGWAPRKAPVLYLDWEAGRNALNRRVRGVAMGANVPHVVQLDYMDCRRRGPLHGFAEDVARMVDREHYGLVIVDSVGMASGTGGDGGDANETAIRLFSAFGYIGTTILAIDHVSKVDAETQSKRSRPYGSVFKSNLARATYEVRRSDASSVVGVYHTKVNDGPYQAPLGLHVAYSDDGAIVYQRMAGLPTELTRNLSLKDQIVAAIRLNGHLTIEELAGELSVEKERVRDTLYKYNRKAFNKLPSGAWELLPEATSHVG